MGDWVYIVLIALGVLNAIMLAVILATGKKSDGDRFEQADRLTEIKNQALISSMDRAFAAQSRSLEAALASLNASLKNFAEQNDKALKEMRFTVDEKLNATLEQRLAGSYNIIAENLNKVALGIGEVNKLADSVGDIKRIFNNVKIRGTWGEMQLETLLTEMLSPEQYVKNCRLDSAIDAFVDFAVAMPDKSGSRTYLPIDSKFPIEEYIRLCSPEPGADTRLAERGLATAIKRQADSIAEKYIRPPTTTDFAIMYLPIEGLYAETLKNAELGEYLRKRRIMACGPTNLGALLNSLQVGFKTVAIEKRSRELWQMLAVFKTEFVKFSALIDKTSKKLQEAQDSMDLAAKRTRSIGRKLKDVAEIGATDPEETDDLPPFID